MTHYQDLSEFLVDRYQRLNKHWTHDDDMLLESCIDRGMTFKEMGAVICRPARGCQARAHRLGMTSKTLDDVRYSADEDAFLIDNYKKLPHKAISKRLGRSTSSLRVRHGRLVEMGLA